MLRLAIMLTFALSIAASAGAAPPNLLLIITDDQGYPDLSVHGNPHLKTPHLDSLRHNGVALDRFYVSPVCSPTRASLMTGRYNYRTGVVDTYIGRSMMHASETTLAERLRAAGYRTGIFGKWHLGDSFPLRAMDQGFDESLLTRGGGLSQPSGPPDNSYFNPRLYHNGVEKPYQGYCTDIFTNAAIDYITTHRAEPFFTYLAYNAPHDPLTVDDRYAQPYRDLGLDDETARIYGMIANIDENVGRLLDTLRASGLEENTLVLFMTDNGAAIKEKQQRHTAGMRGRKSQVYDGGVRVPCFLRWPGTLPAGRVVNDLAAHIDLTPTLLDALGLPLPPHAALDGRSLWNRIKQDDTPLPDRQIFLQWHRGDVPRAFENSAVIEQRFKLVDGKELYDLLADPGETTDLAAQHPEEVARLRADYEAWFADVSSSRGYAPPRIQLAPMQEPVTLLTPQDWRGTDNFNGSDSAHWEVAADAGKYTIELLLPKPLNNAQATIAIGGMRFTQPIPSNATTCRFDGIPLPNYTQDRLAFTVTHDGKDKAVRAARVWRTENTQP
jgi:arylsulfatase A-like enzyme